MSDPYLGTIMPVAFQFAPQDWSTCQGQNYQVSQYSALYSLLGNTFGGNGSQNFNLPDLTGRTIIGQGILSLNGVNTPYNTGVKGGSVTATLTTANVPLAAHTHPVSGTASGSVTINGTQGPATEAGPSTGNVLATASYEDPGTFAVSPVKIYGPASGGAAAPIGTGTVSLSGVTVGANTPTGATPFNIREPYLPLYYIIAINGLYPTRP
ncbi:tail fiber protein [Skermanella rosea]|uniref:phage tail protein n=1 Tax=Skermanella rosea TaxID=1817965 RepID=UPI0019341276|nr:tail fiber protein [Skermanella rosea]UEM02794.1 tail fiber protein [Skermanella rosea]